MSIDIVRGVSHKPVSTEAVCGKIAHIDLIGKMFVGYPIVTTSEGAHHIDALLISPSTGIVVFDLIEGPDVSDYDMRQDDIANKLEARLRNHTGLMNRRELLIPISTISFAPGASQFVNIPEYSIVSTESDLEALIGTVKWEESNDGIYQKALSAIEGITTIRKKRRREIDQEHSRGGKLKSLEDSVATLDSIQNKAVVETFDGIQCIRGLAGSGKTIVLALKAAYLHALHPEWRIGVTFYTRSLKAYFERLIQTFVIQQTGEEPNWENLRVIGAWGSPRDDGIYFEFCCEHGIKYFDYRSAKAYVRRDDPFSDICSIALAQVTEHKPLYHVILVDEAQDLAPEFLKICRSMLNMPNRLVYAYDELQNLSHESLPPPREIFGTELEKDSILGKCYRNPRPILATAHALGFGIYRTSRGEGGNRAGLIQMFDHPNLWKDIGYKLRSGELRDGCSVTLYRSDESSPLFLEQHSPPDDLVKFIHFANEEEQADWLVNDIARNLNDEELRCDDIIVINPDPQTTRGNSGPIRRRLLEMGIDSHIAGVDTPSDIFNLPDSIPFTGVHRAKGNEAGIVYIIHAQDCHSATSRNLASIRNRLFTAITRAKAWVRVLGVGPGMESLIEEFEKLKQNNFELEFIYPTEDERKQLKILHRDMEPGVSFRITDYEKTIEDLIKDIESGDVLPEDLESLKRLQARLRDTDSNLS